MSRRTKWRSITEIIVGLLKNFSEFQKKEGSGPVAVWLEKLSSTQLLLREALVGPEAVAFEQCIPRALTPGWAVRPNR